MTTLPLVILVVIFFSLFVSINFWWTGSTFIAIFDGVGVPIFLASFFYFLPRAGIFISLLSVLGIMFLFLLIFWLAHETSPWLQSRLRKEQEISISNRLHNVKAKRSQSGDS